MDFAKIKKGERDTAQRLSMSAAGAALEGDVKIEAKAAFTANGLETKTFEPGEGRSAEEAFSTSFTPSQKSAIRDMVANAKSPEEIERIEALVRRGIFPENPTSDCTSSFLPVLSQSDQHSISEKRKKTEVEGQNENVLGNKKARVTA